MGIYDILLTDGELSTFGKGAEKMGKFEELRDLLRVNIGKMNDVIHLSKKNEVKEKESKFGLKTVLIVIGAIALIAVVVYVLYRFLAPDYYDDFEDDFDDDFDDDFFDDETEEDLEEV